MKSEAMAVLKIRDSFVNGIVEVVCGGSLSALLNFCFMYFYPFRVFREIPSVEIRARD